MEVDDQLVVGVAAEMLVEVIIEEVHERMLVVEI